MIIKDILFMGKTDYTKQVLANLNLESKIIKNLTLTSNTPVWLAEGELAVNIFDKKLWVGNTLNTPVLILSPIMGADANALAGTTLATNVVFSSLTSVGTLSTLTVTETIIGNISGNAATATALTNTLPISGGGTGQTTVKPALNALLPTQVAKSGRYLRTDGVNAFWDTVNTERPAALDDEITLVGSTLTLVNSAVISKVLTGYTKSSGTIVSTDTILQAIQKLEGNVSTIDGGFPSDNYSNITTIDGGTP